MPHDCTIIIAVYNQARQVQLCLESLPTQTRGGFEVILADDGSSDNLPEVLEAFRTAHPEIRIRHLWHEDDGFRKTIILNAAVRVAESDYLIFVDGDMIMHPRFIEMHLKHRHPKRAMCGWRGVKLGRTYTQELLSGRETFDPSLRNILKRGLKGEIDNAGRATIMQNPLLRNVLFKERGHVGGCNYGIYRENFERVNGMDETILQYGYEDIELGHRLQLNGIEPAGIRNCANTFHLDHPKSANPGIGEIKRRIYACPHKVCRHGLRELDHGSVNDMFLGEIDFDGNLLPTGESAS